MPCMFLTEQSNVFLTKRIDGNTNPVSLKRAKHEILHQLRTSIFAFFRVRGPSATCFLLFLFLVISISSISQTSAMVDVVPFLLRSVMMNSWRGGVKVTVRAQLAEPSLMLGFP